MLNHVTPRNARHAAVGSPAEHGGKRRHTRAVAAGQACGYGCIIDVPILLYCVYLQHEVMLRVRLVQKRECTRITAYISHLI